MSFSQSWMIQLDKSSTRCRRSHDIIESGKLLVEAVGYLACHILKSCIGHRLSTTSLVKGVGYVKSKTLEELVCGDTHLRIECVDVAGNKQSYFHNVKRVIRLLRKLSINAMQK